MKDVNETGNIVRTIKFIDELEELIHKYEKDTNMIECEIRINPTVVPKPLYDCSVWAWVGEFQLLNPDSLTTVSPPINLKNYLVNLLDKSIS